LVLILKGKFKIQGNKKRGGGRKSSESRNSKFAIFDCGDFSKWLELINNEKKSKFLWNKAANAAAEMGSMAPRWDGFQRTPAVAGPKCVASFGLLALLGALASVGHLLDVANVVTGKVTVGEPFDAVFGHMPSRVFHFFPRVKVHPGNGVKGLTIHNGIPK
jgi:hypothetical protein